MNEQWKEYKLEDLLTYEQPTAYIVHSTDYNDAYETPVLTAGKSFVIGRTNESTGIYNTLPVIIFDDFTTATQYVNFPFKVKSSAMKILSANKKLVLTKFIFLRMQIIQFDCSTHKRYWIQQYSKIKVKIPPLPEQERIVAKIEELFSQLDAAVAELNAIKEKLQIYRQAVLKEAFECASNTDKDFCSIDQLLSKSKKGMTTGPFGTMLKKEEHQRSGVPVLGIENIGTGLFRPGNKIFITEAKARELEAFKVSPGDIIISRSGTVGEICTIPDNIGDAYLSTNLIRVSLDRSLIRSDYFVFLFQSKGVVLDQVKEICKGSTRIFLNQNILKQIKFPVPSLDIQKKIVEKIEYRISACNDIDKTIETTLQQVFAMRQSILKQSFGK